MRLHAKASAIGPLGATDIPRRRLLITAILCLGGLFLIALADASAASAAAGSLVLPDNRAWEQVSPVDKNLSDILPESSMASVNGDRVLFRSLGGFAGAVGQFGPNRNLYMTSRGPERWQTTSLMPTTGRLDFQNSWMGFSEDLSKGVLKWQDTLTFGAIDPAAPAGGMNLYLRDNEADSFTLLNGMLSQAGSQGGFVWASGDFSKIAIESKNPLTADAPCPGEEVNAFAACVYEWDNGNPRLASVLPNGEPVEGHAGAGRDTASFENALSNDGSRLFFSSPYEWMGGKEIYARENGSTTSLVSGSERTAPGGISGDLSYYQGAEAAHGDRVIFTTKNTLVDADTNSAMDLYLYDFTKPEGERLTLVSEDTNPESPDGAEIDGSFYGTGGILARSQDLRRIYFVTTNQLLTGEPEEPGAKLYLWDDTGSSPRLTYIATLASDFFSGDARDWLAPTIDDSGNVKPARSSANGRFVAFLSVEKLTDFDNEGQQEVYFYDAIAHSLECASCSADAYPEIGGISFDVAPAIVTHPLRNVSESGQVFFQTARGLVPRDSNGKWDVYEYQNGTLNLISRGTGDSDSKFMDASPSGDDVFFTTKDRLVGWDRDENTDAYDARVNGGLPEPPPGPPPCEGDSCQPPPVVPVDPSLASTAFNGPGDPSTRKRRARRCAKGMVRRHGKCRRKRGRQAPSHRKHTVSRSQG